MNHLTQPTKLTVLLDITLAGVTPHDSSIRDVLLLERHGGIFSLADSVRRLARTLLLLHHSQVTGETAQVAQVREDAFELDTVDNGNPKPLAL